MINETLFYSPPLHILPIYPSTCVSLFLFLFLSSILSPTLDSSPKFVTIDVPAVCTERDETLMHRGSLVRARNFGFLVHHRRLAAHIRRVRRRYELRGSNRRSFDDSTPFFCV